MLVFPAPHVFLRHFRPSLNICLAAVIALMCGTASLPLPAQVQRNAGFESTTFAVVKATLIVSPDEQIDEGTLVIRDGLIVAAGKDVLPPADAQIIDGAGLVVYAGFIDAATSSLLD